MNLLSARSISMEVPLRFKQNAKSNTNMKNQRYIYLVKIFARHEIYAGFRENFHFFTNLRENKSMTLCFRENVNFCLANFTKNKNS